MKITRQHTFWIVILAIIAGVVLFIVRARVAAAMPDTQSDGRVAKVRLHL